jgi:UDP-N-acetylmuramate dehydrogenase
MSAQRRVRKQVREHVPLSPLTTLSVGGEARFFVEATSTEEVFWALEFAHARTLPVFVLGGGSNVVIADSGFHGLVLALRIPGIEESDRGDRVWVTVGSGVMWDDFVVWSIERGLSGLECLSGIPGTVGGAVVANLGAYGAQCSDTFVHAEVVDTRDAKLKVLGNEACDFSYHDSIFSHEQSRYVIVSATFALSKDPAAQPSYRDNRFDMQALTALIGHTPSQQEVREAVLSVREEKGSLIMYDRLSYKSAGSFFHMPFVSPGKYEEIAQRARTLDAHKEEHFRPWAWKQPNDSYKIAPGFLLEYTEFVKGYVRGGAGISPRHTLSIINVAGAKAADIAELASDMQKAVEKIFGVTLEREVEYIGEVEQRKKLP